MVLRVYAQLYGSSFLKVHEVPLRPELSNAGKRIRWRESGELIGREEEVLYRCMCDDRRDMGLYRKVDDLQRNVLKG